MFQQIRHTDFEEREGIPTMRKTTRKLTAVLLSAVCTLTAALPAFSCTCAAAETSDAAEDYSVKIVSFEASDQLAEMIYAIEGGSINLSLDKEGKQPAGLAVGDRENNSVSYYAYTNSGALTRGKQCYIYSQAAYGTLFDELPLHGLDPAAPYRISEQAAGFAELLTPEFLTEHAVMPGAYFRTTSNEDGSYNGSSGHSMIILGYNPEKIRILEGNGDGNGLVRDVELTYEKFNLIYLTRKGRYVGHIIQPTAEYYRSRFGLVFGEFPDAPKEEPAEEDTVPQLGAVPDKTNESKPAVCTLPDVTLGHFRDAVSAAADVSASGWTSSDPEIASVDADGTVRPGSKNGTAVITAQTADGILEFKVTSDLLPWEEVGDFDGNGRVTAEDASLSLALFTKMFIGIAEECDAETLRRADTDGDGRVTAKDSSMILQFFTEGFLGLWTDAEAGWRSQCTS